MTDHIKAISELEAELRDEFRISSNGEWFQVEERQEEINIFSKNVVWWKRIDGPFGSVSEALNRMKKHIRNLALRAHGYHPIRIRDVYLTQEEETE